MATAKKSAKKPAKKPAAKKPAAKKPAAKKAPAKKAAPKKAAPKKAAKKPAAKRKPNAAFMKAMTPSSSLAAVVGAGHRLAVTGRMFCGFRSYPARIAELSPSPAVCA